MIHPRSVHPPSAHAAAAVTTTATSFVPPAIPKKDLKEEYRQGTAALNSDLENDMAPVPREAYIKLPSGVIYADVVKPPPSSSMNTSGSNVVQAGSKVNIQWVLRRSNGYFVDSSQLHDSVPFVFTVGGDPIKNVPTTAIAGLDEGIRGMQMGGVRRLLIPPSLAYVHGVDDGLPGPIPVGYGPRQQIRRIQSIRKDVPGEYIYLEIQLTRLR
jgi:FKBP-type peptidyl-prolyl cis-trans isomerase